MAEIIQGIFIHDAETRSTPKPHTVYQIEVHAAVRTWNVWKRYSEFVKLHTQFTKIFSSNPPPVKLPGKRIFPSTFSSLEKIEERRCGLEDYLRGILSYRDNRWRQTDVWREFLAIPVSRSIDSLTMYTSETWLDEYNGMNNMARELRSLISRRSTHVARSEISASHNCTVQAKKLLFTLSSKLSTLNAGLSSLELAEGESRRRKDMLSTLRDERDALQSLVNSGRQEQDLMKQEQQPRRRSNTIDSEKAALLTNGGHGFPPNNKVPVRRKSSISPGRTFGAAAAKETEITCGLDNGGLVQYQQQVMKDQDFQVEQFSALLARQKQLGLAIGDELEVQNQILDELDTNVDRTATKLKLVNKKLTTVK